MDDSYAARIPLFAISSPMTDIANQPQHFPLQCLSRDTPSPITPSIPISQVVLI